MLINVPHPHLSFIILSVAVFTGEWIPFLNLKSSDRGPVLWWEFWCYKLKPSPDSYLKPFLFFEILFEREKVLRKEINVGRIYLISLSSTHILPSIGWAFGMPVQMQSTTLGVKYHEPVKKKHHTFIHAHASTQVTSGTEDLVSRRRDASQSRDGTYSQSHSVRPNSVVEPCLDTNMFHFFFQEAKAVVGEAVYVMRNEIGDITDQEDYGQARRQSGMFWCPMHRKLAPSLLNQQIHRASQMHLLDCFTL